MMPGFFLGFAVYCRSALARDAEHSNGQAHHVSFIAGKRAPTGMNHVGASLLAKRLVHPNILQLQDQRLREQARSHRFRIRHTALPFFAGKPRSNRHLIRPRLHDPRQVVLDPDCKVFTQLYQYPWERACSRRGRYIPTFSDCRTTAFASKLAPTGFVSDPPRYRSSRASLAPTGI